MLVHTQIKNHATSGFIGRECNFELDLPTSIDSYISRFGVVVTLRWLEAQAKISGRAVAKVALQQPEYRQEGFVSSYVKANWNPSETKRLSKVQRIERDVFAMTSEERKQLIAQCEGLDGEEE